MLNRLVESIGDERRRLAEASQLIGADAARYELKRHVDQGGVCVGLS